MGKAVMTGIIDEKSKAAIVKAALPILGKSGSMTKLLEQIGYDFASEIERLEALHGSHLPRCELRIQMIPKP